MPSLKNETKLTLLLRCDNNLGILTIAQGQSAQTDKFQEIMNVDLTPACNTRKVDLTGYHPKNKLLFTLKEVYVRQPKAIAEYGSDIQRVEGGFYTILKVSDTPPYLINVQI